MGYYFGEKSKKIALTLVISGSFGVLLVYLIVGGQFLSAVFSPILGGNPTAYVFLYFAIAAAVIYFDVKIISKIELWSLIFLIFTLSLIFVKYFYGMNFGNIFASPEKISSNLFLPYGAILFSLWGTGLIPEVEEMIIGRKHLLKKIVVASILFPAIVYFLFILLVLSITGAGTTDSALVGLKNYLGNGLSSLALLAGATTIFAAFISGGLLLKKNFMYDMGMAKLPSWALTCFVPLVLFLVGFNAFIPLISFVGGVILGINGILILRIYGKIGGKKMVIYPLAIIFAIGIIYEIMYFVK